MNSDAWNFPTNSLNRHADSNVLLDTVSTVEKTLVPRLRRYVHEIGDVLNRALEESRDTTNVCSDNVLCEVEEHITVQGLCRQVIQLNGIIKKLNEENNTFKEKIEHLHALEPLKASFETCQKECNEWKAIADKTQKEMEIKAKDHLARYDALHTLFESVTNESNKNMLLCDTYRSKIETLELEKKTLEEKLQTLEASHHEEKETFTKLNEENLKTINVLQEEVTELRKSCLVLQSKTSKNEENSEEMEKTIEKHKKEMLRLQERNNILKEKNSNLSNQLTKHEETLLKLKKIKNAHVALKEKFKEELLRHKNGQNEKINKLQNELLEWKQAVENANLSISTEPTPALLRLFLLSFTETDQFKKSITDNSKHLVNENLHLSTHLTCTNDELQRIQLECNEQKHRIHSLEYELNLLIGQLQSEKQRHSDSTQKSSGGNDNEKNSINVSNTLTSNHDVLDLSNQNDIMKLIQHIQQERSSFTKTLSDYKNQMHSFVEDKEKLLKKVELSRQNFAELEMMLTEKKSETIQLQSLLKQQKSMLDIQKQMLSQYDSVSYLQSQRDEALRQCDMTHEFYKKEAMTFRAIIKTLLGWHIQIDLESMQNDVTVTLRPALAKHYNDDAAIIFHVKAKDYDSKRWNTLPKDVIEEEVYTMFCDEDFDMHLDGRFADKWDTDLDWKNQLSARCSYAAFLAITILAEQNQILYGSAFIAAQQIKKVKCDANKNTHEN